MCGRNNWTSLFYARKKNNNWMAEASPTGKQRQNPPPSVSRRESDPGEGQMFLGSRMPGLFFHNWQGQIQVNRNILFLNQTVLSWGNEWSLIRLFAT